MLFPGLSYPPNTAAHPIGVVQLHALQLCNDYSSSIPHLMRVLTCFHGIETSPTGSSQRPTLSQQPHWLLSEKLTLFSPLPELCLKAWSW